MTKIQVAKHAQRYIDVDTKDKIALIEELQKLVENDRQKLIADMKLKLAKLEGGEFPIEKSESEALPQPKKSSEPAPVEIINEEPEPLQETTEEEAATL